MVHNNHLDPNRYVSHYVDQVGNGLPGYHGTPTMYGLGIGGIFHNLFRMVLLFMKGGLSIAKPHLKSAAKNIVSEVVDNAMTRRASSDPEHQGLSGLCCCLEGLYCVKAQAISGCSLPANSISSKTSRLFL